MALMQLGRTVAAKLQNIMACTLRQWVGLSDGNVTMRELTDVRFVRISLSGVCVSSFKINCLTWE